MSSINIFQCLNNLAGMHIQIKSGVLLITMMSYRQSVMLV